MKNFCFFLLLSSIIWQLDAQICKIDSSLNQISGLIERCSIIHGGMYRKDEPIEDEETYSPLADFSMAIIRYIDDSSYFFCSFTTGKDGKFSFSLPDGKYGLWPGNLPLSNSKSAKDQKPYQIGGLSENQWSYGLPNPFEIKNKNISGIVIQNRIEGYAP